MKAQQSRASDQAELETKNNMSYYQRRGLEDAQHEQELEVKSKEEHTFWEEQKKYEKELKKKIEEHIERIFKVKEGYAAHHNYCDSHCHHSEYWYQHAGYYYYEYREPRYENRASRTTVNTQIG
jgi:uncharacterized protein YwqG